MRDALKSNKLSQAYSEKETAALNYAALLTREPGQVTEQTLDMMRQTGLEDGEILEINQVTSYFCYANRTVLGLGINKEKTMLGLSPSTKETDDWSHT